jgi:hypothetical protein
LFTSQNSKMKTNSHKHTATKSRAGKEVL